MNDPNELADLAKALISLHVGQNSRRAVETPDAFIERALRTVRHFLGMETAFISEFAKDDRVFRFVDSSLPVPILTKGDRVSLLEGYCRRIVDGTLPELIPDTRDVPAAMAIPETTSMPIGSHLSVPIRLSDGSLYGTFCCFSSRPDPSLNARDLQLMKTVADIIGFQIETDALLSKAFNEKKARIQSAIDGGNPNIVYQPVYNLSNGRLEGSEALARFAMEPSQAPDKWFAEATDVGLRTELEVAAIRNALSGYELAWRGSDFHLAVNLAPSLIAEQDLTEVFAPYDTDRIVIEVTEHEGVDDYDALIRSLAPLREMGMKVAVDDIGSGIANMRHVLKLSPDIMKLDASIIKSIDRDRSARIMVFHVVQFAEQTGSTVLAEGIETAAEYRTLAEAGVHHGQGYLLGRPGTVDMLMESPRVSEFGDG